MKRSNDLWKPALTAALMVAAATACTPTNVQDGEKEKATLSRIDSRSSGDRVTPLKDTPAATSFKELSRIFVLGREGDVSLNIYQLAAPPSDPRSYLKKRAEQLGIMEGEFFYPNDNVDKGIVAREEEGVRTLGIHNKQYELSVNLDSGSEFLVDTRRFHDNKGVSPKELRPDAYYLETGQRYITAQLGDVVNKSTLYPYKVRHYMDAVSKEGGEPLVTAAQIAVAYNASIDGLAVIGPGDKVVVHMTPEGEVIAYESTLLSPVKGIAEISGRDLLDPRKAEEAVMRRLKARGVDLEDYTLTRSEFGYLRLGRNSIQGVLSPHYAFVFEPRSEKVVGRKIFEIVPAVVEAKSARIIEADLQREQQRKTRIIEKAGKPDIRR